MTVLWDLASWLWFYFVILLHCAAVITIVLSHLIPALMPIFLLITVPTKNYDFSVAHKIIEQEKTVWRLY